MCTEKGMVAIAYPHHAKISVIDRKLMKMNMESISGCLPVRIGEPTTCTRASLLCSSRFITTSCAMQSFAGGFHICHPPWCAIFEMEMETLFLVGYSHNLSLSCANRFFGKIVFPIMKMVMPERMRKRVRVHVGTEQKVLDSLKAFGLDREVLPSELGGDVIIDTDSWIQDMKSRGL